MIAIIVRERKATTTLMGLSPLKAEALKKKMQKLFITSGTSTESMQKKRSLFSRIGESQC